MTAPRQVSRTAFEAFDGERWNAYVDLLAMSELAQLTPRQRVAYLAFWYDAEVQNGGHDQYFGNQESFDHAEVARALETLGAECQAGVLRRAWAFVEHAAELQPEGHEQFVRWDESFGYSRQLQELDREYAECSPELSPRLLERYLDAHESEFIEWVDAPAGAPVSSVGMTLPLLVVRPGLAFWIEDRLPAEWSATVQALREGCFRDACCYDLMGTSWRILGADFALPPSLLDRLLSWRQLPVTVTLGPPAKAAPAEILAELTRVLCSESEFCDWLNGVPEEIRRRLEAAASLPHIFAIVREVS